MSPHRVITTITDSGEPDCMLVELEPAWGDETVVVPMPKFIAQHLKLGDVLLFGKSDDGYYLGELPSP